MGANSSFGPFYHGIAENQINVMGANSSFGPVWNQGVQSNWREEPDINHTRAIMLRKFAEIFRDLPTMSRCGQEWVDEKVMQFESIRFMGAASQDEYINISQDSLKQWMKMIIETQHSFYSSQTGAFNDQLEVVARSNKQITDEAAVPFQSFPNYCSPVGLSEYPQDVYQQHPTQGMFSHSPGNGLLDAGGNSGWVTWEGPDQQFQHQQTQSTFSQFNFNGELAANGSAEYRGEAAIASETTKNYYHPADCFTYQQPDLDQQIEHYNGVVYRQNLQPFAHGQDAFCHICDANKKTSGAVTSYPGFAMPKVGTHRTRNDGNVGGHTGDTLEDIVCPLKRRKIYDPSSSFAGYETLQPLAPIDLSLSPQGLPQMLHQGDISEDIEETPKHQKIDDPTAPLFSRYEALPAWSPIDLRLSPQELPEMHQHPYVSLLVGSNCAEANIEHFASPAQDCLKSITSGNEDPENFLELKFDWDSVISKEPIDSSNHEDIVENIFNQAKTEVEHIPVVDHVAGSISENSNTKIMPSAELFTPEKIKEPVMNSIQDCSNFSEFKLDHSEDSLQAKLCGDFVTLEEIMPSSNQELVHVEPQVGQAEPEVEDEIVESNSDKSKIKGASLTELFSLEQIKEHVASLRQWFGESKAKAGTKWTMANSMNDQEACQSCAMNKLCFEAPRCSSCGAHFKLKANYYTASEDDAKYYFCTTCYNKTEGESITVGGLHIEKERLEKKCNEKIQEPWVECDKCKNWHHQICALFNNKRNEDEKAEYICPACYIQEIEIGQRKPLRQSAILGAKDLRRTKLSDFIEGRLFRRLKQEREERAKSFGKNFNEVPGVEDLVLRVVLNADKKVQVKQSLLDVFKDENYPKEFPYRSKVILLFQKIEGVEVCLFGMYVQEFGSECAHPNQRSVYISYLDSVKFFKPDIKTASGESLRTFVYHEILVGYLDYCKKRGFNRCYIWSCPPSKADDYIFYCHPKIQKALKTERLREWYHAMLRKAASEKIVTDVTNLYEHFFVPHGECKVTATSLPYFDGDYWPRAAEDMLKDLVEEEREKPRRKQKKPKSRKSLEAIGCTDFLGTSVMDTLLMQNLGKSICKTKENFIMVNLESEQMALDTEDEDEIMEMKIFDSRETFLCFCETNHYQFDTLRRAKHSSMMLLYHLHNPSA